MITERVDKVLQLDYEMLEKPEVLDLQERAQQATNGNNNGVEGMMLQIFNLGNGYHDL